MTVVVAGQDPLLHYTTLCLFCLKVFGGEEQWEQKRAHSLKKDETVAVSVKIKFPPAIDQVLQFKARSQKLFQVESNMESAFCTLLFNDVMSRNMMNYKLHWSPDHVTKQSDEEENILTEAGLRV